MKYQITFKNQNKKEIECDSVGSANGLISFDKREGEMIFPLYIYSTDDIAQVKNLSYTSNK